MFKLREEKIIANKGYWGYMMNSSIIHIQEYSENSEKSMEFAKNAKRALFVVEKPVYAKTKLEAIEIIEKRLNGMSKSLHLF